MSAITLSVPTTGELSAATCTCGADRGRRLVRLDRAVDAGQVTTAEAAERRVQLLAR
jgi:hypothetical protein